MAVAFEGAIEKMTASLSSPIKYQLPIGDACVDMNPLLGKKIRLQYLGAIRCIHCQRPTKKSFNQGYCYPCFQKLASCDICIMSPEKCHYAQGTCREPEWAKQHCFTEHIVYLSNTSGPKVGITRASQIPTRWIDQGAIQALPIVSVNNRHHSGLIEHALKQHVADKTNWQSLLKGDALMQDLLALRDNLLETIGDDLKLLKKKYGQDAYRLLPDAKIVDMKYPVKNYPVKVKSLDFDKQVEITGELHGIKGQYLLLDCGVLNIRKFTAYQINFSTLPD